MAAVGVVAASCAQPTPEVIEKEVPVEKIVKETVVVEKQVPVEKVVKETVVVEKQVAIEKVVTATPIPAKYSESPMLAAKVKAGSLPPVDERVPIEPLVVTPIEIGKYGGTMHVGCTTAGLVMDDGFNVADWYGPNFFRLTPDLQDAVPNIGTAWEMAADAKSFTVHMRKGMKWSDGQPFTAEDMRWWYEDVLSNKELTASPSAWFKPGGTLMQFEKKDDYTITFKFAAPYAAFFLVALAHKAWWITNGDFAPAHYLKQFHIKYNPKVTDEAKANKFEFWYQYYNKMMDSSKNPAKPTLKPYYVREAVVDTDFLERNPYYFMVDSEGNQLPYIDEINVHRVADIEMYNAKIVSGEWDFAGRNTSLMNYATYDAASKDNKYHILLWRSGKGSECLYQVNLNYPDPVLRPIFQDVRFRRALSMAINREEINQTIYFGRAKPRQMTVATSSKYLKPEYETAWAEYSPEKANALLDEMGLKWDAAHKNRLLPDGNSFIINWDFVELETPKGPITELVKEYWQAIGVEINVKSITRTLLTPKVTANEEPMGLWHGDMVSDHLIPRDTRWFIGAYRDDCCMCPLWSQWYEGGGKAGEQPPDWWMEKAKWFEDFKSTLDPALIGKILQSQADNLWSIGTVCDAPQPVIVRDTLMNVPEDGVWAYDSMWTAPQYPMTWFFKS